MPDLLSVTDLSRAEMDELLAMARDHRDGAGGRRPDAVIGLMFYEDSLRTRVGFDIAAARLGARSVTVSGPRRSEAMWGDETPADAVRSVGDLVDVLCLRHPEARTLASLVSAPVLNCGDGAREHPVQALVDLFAIDELRGTLDGLRCAIVGDLDAMRTAHSLALALTRFPDIHVRCIAPDGLDLPADVQAELSAAGATVTRTTDMEVSDVDVVYMAGLPAVTRVGVLDVPEQARFHMTPAVAAQLPEGARVLCPLPRVDEIDPAVDALPWAGYFAQARSAVWMRMALLDRALGDRMGA